MTTFATIFSGGELGGVGMQAAGWRHLWGIELDPQIAQVARMNGFDGVHVADARCVNFATLERPDHLHVSPPCTRASVANSDATESPLDRELAEAVCRSIRTLLPDTFTLENVYGYRRFRAYKAICDCLDACGYWWEHHHINSADMGVPQTRKRLILRATRGDYLRPLPSPVRWVGWYEAIEDLIPTLPPSSFAPWQIDRLPNGLMETLLVSKQYDAPQGVDGRAPRLFTRDEPASVILSSAGSTSGDQFRAFLVDGKTANYAGDLQIAGSAAPTPTLTASQTRHPFRAWLEEGRVVAMTPRALMRFMSGPDTYELPASKKLACQIIGNGVPPLLMQRIAESLT